MLCILQDVDECWSAWINYFLQAMELCIPHTTVKVNRNLPRKIIGAIKKGDTLFRIAKLTGTSSDQTKYSKKAKPSDKHASRE